MMMQMLDVLYSNVTPTCIARIVTSLRAGSGRCSVVMLRPRGRPRPLSWPGRHQRGVQLLVPGAGRQPACLLLPEII